MTKNIQLPPKTIPAGANHRPGRDPTAGGVSLDTLAQLETNTPNGDDFSLNSSTNKADKKVLLKRARRKFLSNGLTLGLVRASEGNPTSSLGKSYWNTWHCASELEEKDNGSITGRYCKNRWCQVCNSIRVAKLINDYQPALDSMEDKQFVTLTGGVTVPGDQLRGRFDEMAMVWTKLKKRYVKRHQRGSGRQFRGIRKIECTYSKGLYHAHFHVIIDGEGMADQLVNDWLKEFPEADRQAQDIRPADEGSNKELFKYFTKIIGTAGKKDRAIYADSLDVIFNAVRGKRTFQPFGIRARVKQEPGEDQADQEEAGQRETVAVYEWQQDCADWVERDNYQQLTNYQPAMKFLELVSSKIWVRPCFHIGHKGDRPTWKGIPSDQLSIVFDRFEQGVIEFKDLSNIITRIRDITYTQKFEGAAADLKKPSGNSIATQKQPKNTQKTLITTNKATNGDSLKQPIPQRKPLPSRTTRDNGQREANNNDLEPL